MFRRQIITVKNKVNFAIFTLLLPCVSGSLTAFPYYFSRVSISRMYGKDVIVDLFYDCHDKQLSNIPMNKEHLDDIAEIFAGVYSKSKGGTRFIWECSSLDLALRDEDPSEFDEILNLDRIRALNTIKKFTDISKVIKNEKFIGIYENILKEISGANGFPQCAILNLPQTLLNLQRAEFNNLTNTNKERSNIEHLRERYLASASGDYMSSLVAKLLDMGVSKDHILASDNLRSSNFNIRSICPIINAFYNYEFSTNEAYLACKHDLEVLLVQFFVSMCIILFNVKDFLNKSILRLYSSNKISMYANAYCFELQKCIFDTILPNIIKFIDSDDEHNNKIYLRLLANQEKTWLVKTMDFEVLLNIVSAIAAEDVTRIIFYAGGDHCKNLYNFLLSLNSSGDSGVDQFRCELLGKFGNDTPSFDKIGTPPNESVFSRVCSCHIDLSYLLSAYFDC